MKVRLLKKVRKNNYVVYDRDRRLYLCLKNKENNFSHTHKDMCISLCRGHILSDAYKISKMQFIRVY